jgi:hypothetical protein
MTQTILASLILIAALLYIGRSMLKAISPKKKSGCGCCGCGDKLRNSPDKKAPEEIVSINR